MSPPTRNRALPTLGALALLLAGPAGADTFNVDRFDDSTASLCSPLIANDCGLRGAILEANSNPGDDVVRLQAGTYTLSIPGVEEDAGQTGDLDVTGTLLIVGKGPELTVVDAGGDGGVSERVLDVHAPGGFLTLRGVTVTGGHVGPFGEGGGIRVQGGSLRLETCAVNGNDAVDEGGAIFAVGVGADDGVEIVDSWISGNSARNCSAISTSAAFQLERSTISGNAAGADAAVCVLAAGAALTNSTISGNTGSDIGGVIVAAPSVSLTDCTLAGNSWGQLFAPSYQPTLADTVIVGGCGSFTDVVSLGGNLESPGDTCGLAGGDLVNVPDPGLSALGFFGGPAPVHRPLAGSPALDAPVAAPGYPALDQRGLSRPRDGDGNGSAVCDIGAVELAAPGEIFVETFDCGFTTPWSDVVP